MGQISGVSAETIHHSISVYSCLSDRSQSEDWLLSKGHAGKSASDQRLQPMADQ